MKEVNELIAELEDETMTPLQGGLKEPAKWTVNKQKATQKGRWRRIAMNWRCPICPKTAKSPEGFCTGVTRGWTMRRNEHIKTYHPDRRKELVNGHWLSKFPKLHSVKDVINTGDVTWKCALCDACLTEPATGDKAREVRAQHGKVVHPEADKRIFLLKRRNTKPANLKVVQIALMRRIMQLKVIPMPHKVEFICWPFGNRKDRRELFCMQCGRTARSVKQMAKLPCTPVFPGEKGWGRRKKTIADFNGAIGTLSKDKEKTARKILDVLLRPMHNPNMIRQREFVPKHEGNTTLTALDKDLFPICMMAMEQLKDEGKDPASRF